MSRVLVLLRIVGGTVVGYALMVVGITLVQETLFGGVSYHESSLLELATAGPLTVLCGAVGGLVAVALAGGRPVPCLVMAGLVVVETTALTLTGKLDGPLWFDLVASGSLIAGILAGGYMVVMRRARMAAAA